jgi:hypothetical protein
MSGRHRAQSDLPRRKPGVAWERLASETLSQPGDADRAQESWKPDEHTLMLLARVRCGLRRL